MKVYDAGDIRNLGVIGHGDTGKTSLVSSMLFCAGASPRFGKVDDGTTVTDFDEEEIARKTSISSALAHLEWDKKKFNILDTPGYANFIADARAAIPIQIPIGAEHDFKGVVDLVRSKAWTWPADESGKPTESDVPADLKEDVGAARQAMIEAVAETDDALMETFFDKGELSQQQ